MNKKQKNKVDVFYLVCFAFFLGVAMTFVIALSICDDSEPFCESLGYDRQALNRCVLRLDFDKETGEYNYCYMPTSEEVHADEWCGIEKEITQNIKSLEDRHNECVELGFDTVLYYGINGEEGYCVKAIIIKEGIFYCFGFNKDNFYESGCDIR